MSETKTCAGPCARELIVDHFYAGRARCKDCYNAAITARRTKPKSVQPSKKWAAVEAFDAASNTGCAECGCLPPGEKCAECSPILEHAHASAHAAAARFGTPMQRACVEALLACGSVELAAISVQLTAAAFRAHLSELERRAAARGHAPDADMTKTTPEGFSVKGVSTMYDGDGNVRAQWVKTRRDEDAQLAAILDAMSHISDAWHAKADPVPASEEIGGVRYDDRLLAVYPMGDPHIGLMSWSPETGEDFDLKIAERNLCDVVDKLVHLAPPAREALVVNVGDFWHSDNKFNTTTAGTRVDVDGRWSKVLAVGIRIMRRIIDSALTKHEKVTVINEIGNHDSHVSIMLATCLAQFYEREPRVHIDTSPAKFHWFRFGKNLIGVTHGDTIKFKDLGEIMACDRPQDWGETVHRYWYCGHIHHDTVKELRGVKVETFRTMAAADAWHRGQGYRSGRDMKMIVLHREYGEILRSTVGVDQLLLGSES